MLSASTAPLGRIAGRSAKDARAFAQQHQISSVQFVKGQRKDDVTAENLATFTRRRVWCSSAGRRRTQMFRTEKRRDAEGRSYSWIVKSIGGR